MRKNRFFAILALLMIGGIMFSGCGKKGCMDPASNNFDADATKDDGNCSYSTTYTESGTSPEGKTNVRVKDYGEGTGTMTWTSDKVYILEGFVFVNDGQQLTIEAGTIVKGAPGSGASASALIIARGAKITANGTSTNPIIFTSEQDDVTNVNSPSPGTRGLWGGLIVLGKGQLNSNPGTTAIEGIPTTEERGIYGGTDDNDNSGSLKYISIRYGGTDIGEGNEINGLTLGGVGSATTIDYVEVIYNADDGIEFFGGSPQVKHIVVAFCGDDCFDYDEGFRGKGQFWLGIQSTTDGDRGGEHDGGTDPETATPYAHPVMYNATYIGGGDAAGKRTVTFRDNAGGEYHNSIFMEFAKGIDIEITHSGENSYKRYTDGITKLQNNTFWNVKGNDPAKIFDISWNAGDFSGQADSATVISAAKANVLAYFAIAGNSVANPGIIIGRTPAETLNPIPATPPAAGSNPPVDGFYDQVNYVGAFGATNWLTGWTYLSAAGFF